MTEKQRKFCRMVNFMKPMLAAEFAGYTLREVQNEKLADFLETDEAQDMITLEKEKSDKEIKAMSKEMEHKLEETDIDFNEVEALFIEMNTGSKSLKMVSENGYVTP